MICSKCGKENKNSSAFCQFCGNPLNAQTTVAQKAPVAPNNIQPINPPAGTNTAATPAANPGGNYARRCPNCANIATRVPCEHCGYNAQSAAQNMQFVSEGQTKKNKKTIIIIIAVALVILIAAAVFIGIFISKKEDTKSETKTTTTTQTTTAKINSKDNSDKKITGESAEIIAMKKIKPNVKIPSNFKIGLICLHDENSTYDKNFIDAMRATAQGMGLTDAQVIIKTSIDESDSCYDAAVDLVENHGCKVIFADSFGHETYMIKAAKKYPKVQFCHASGASAKSAGLSNFHNAYAAIYEGRYIAGVAAGIKLNDMIKMGKITAEQAIIGYVGAFAYAEVISDMTAFYLGAKSVCPSATMKVRYTDSWYDKESEQAAAMALIKEDNCVLISQHSDSIGAPTACENAGVPNVSYNGSTYAACKNTFLISSKINWAPYFQHIIENTVKGKAIETNWCGTVKTNSILISGINTTLVDSKAAIDELNKVIEQLKAGKLHVFDTSTFTVTVDAAQGINTNAQVDKSGHLVKYMADMDIDFVGDTNVVHDGYFDECGSKFRSAPYFDILIDGITIVATGLE